MIDHIWLFYGNRQNTLTLVFAPDTGVRYDWMVKM